MSLGLRWSYITAKMDLHHLSPNRDMTDTQPGHPPTSLGCGEEFIREMFAATNYEIISKQICGLHLD